MLTFTFKLDFYDLYNATVTCKINRALYENEQNE